MSKKRLIRFFYNILVYVWLQFSVELCKIASSLYGLLVLVLPYSAFYLSLWTNRTTDIMYQHYVLYQNTENTEILYQDEIFESINKTYVQIYDIFLFFFPTAIVESCFVFLFFCSLTVPWYWPYITSFQVTLPLLVETLKHFLWPD